MRKVIQVRLAPQVQAVLSDRQETRVQQVRGVPKVIRVLLVQLVRKVILVQAVQAECLAPRVRRVLPVLKAIWGAPAKLALKVTREKRVEQVLRVRRV